MAYKTAEQQRANAKRHYDSNKEMYAERNRRAKDRLRQIIRDAKSVPCTDCGVQYPHYVMDFDHLGDKEYNVGSMVGLGSKTKLLAEIEKCEVVCSNCHRERTYSRNALIV